MLLIQASRRIRNRLSDIEVVLRRLERRLQRIKSSEAFQLHDTSAVHEASCMDSDTLKFSVLKEDQTAALVKIGHFILLLQHEILGYSEAATRGSVAQKMEVIN